MKYPYRNTKVKIPVSTDKIIFTLIGGFTFLALVLIGIFTIQEQNQKASANVATFSATDSEKPVTVVSEKFSDLGYMKVSEEKGAKFTIENKGNKPLSIFNITSSCGCTVGKITIGGKVSPEFGMHSKSKWMGELPPDEKASVDVIYRPFVMPVR